MNGVSGRFKDTKLVSFNMSDPEPHSPKSTTTTTTVTVKRLNVEELEMLLEAYFVVIDGIVNRVSTVRTPQSSPCFQDLKMRLIDEMLLKYIPYILI